VISESHRRKDLNATVNRVSEYLADLSLLSLELRTTFDACDLADACRIVARVALGLQAITSDCVFARQGDNHSSHYTRFRFSPVLEECCRQVRLMWMEFNTPGSFTNRFLAIANKFVKFDVAAV
jgi:hypothetical protein